MSGNLEAGIPLCPPEGDAGTGMAATNSVRVRTGNVSAGTSVFAMIVLEKNLSKVYPEIDMVTTPSGHPVAMVHCQNCTSDLNAWVNLFREFAQTFGMEISTNDLFGKLYNKALEGDADCGGLLAYNYFSGEINKEENETLEDYLDAKVFAGNAGTKMDPDPADVAGFEVFTERYKKGLPIERAAVESLK